MLSRPIEIELFRAGNLPPVEHDPARLADVERRRDLVFRLVKKYGGSIAAAQETGREARAELSLLDSAALDLRELDESVAMAEAALTDAAKALTKARHKAASRLEREVEAQFPGLGLEDGRFHVVLAPRTEIGAAGAELERQVLAEARAGSLGRRTLAGDAGAQDDPRRCGPRADAHLR